MRIGFFICLLFFSISASEYDSLETMLIKTVLAGNTGLSMFSCDSAAFDASSGAVGALPAPQIAVESMQEKIGSSIMRMQTDFSVTQEMPFPGTRPAMSRAMKARSFVSGAARQELARSLAADTKRTLAELAFAWRRLDISDSAISELSAAVKIATSRYSSGLAGLIDKCAIEAEIAMIRADSAQAESDILAVQARLAGLAGKPALAGIARVNTHITSILEMNVDSLLPMVLSNPSLLKLEAVVGADHADISSAKRKAAPDLMFKGTYRNTKGEPDQYGIMIGATLPESWAWKNVSASRAEKEFVLRRDKAELDGARISAETEIQAKVLTYTGLLSRLKAIQGGAVPLAGKALAAAAAGYREGVTDFNMYISAGRTMRAALSDEAETEMKLRQTLAEICEITGH